MGRRLGVTAGARRRLTAAAIALGVVAGMTGCDLYAPQETLHIAEAGTGVNGNVGEVFIGNAVLLRKDNGEGPASLVTTFVNLSALRQRITVTVGSHSTSVSLRASASQNIGLQHGRRIILTSVQTKPGALADVTFESGGATTILQVPMLNGTLPQYADLVP